MSSTKLEIMNTSGAHDLRISLQHALRGDGSQISGWGESRPVTSLTPCQKVHVLITDASRAVIETASADDILLAFGNPSLQSTLKIITLPKKGDPVTRFVPPTRNGIAADPVTVAVSKNASVLVQQLPV